MSPPTLFLVFKTLRIYTLVREVDYLGAMPSMLPSKSIKVVASPGMSGTSVVAVAVAVGPCEVGVDDALLR